MIEDEVRVYGPDNKGPVKWTPIVRVGMTIPFGYMQDPEDENLLLPVETELEALEEAKKYLLRYGSRTVANWLSEKTGRYISHTGLIKRVKSEKRRHAQLSYTKQLIKRLEKAIKTAEKLEQGSLGATADSTSDSETPGD